MLHGSKNVSVPYAWNVSQQSKVRLPNSNLQSEYIYLNSTCQVRRISQKNRPSYHSLSYSTTTQSTSNHCTRIHSLTYSLPSSPKAVRSQASPNAVPNTHQTTIPTRREHRQANETYGTRDCLHPSLHTPYTSSQHLLPNQTPLPRRLSQRCFLHKRQQRPSS